MPSTPLDSTHGRTTSGVTCQHPLWTAHTIERRRAWYDITALRQNTWSNDVGRDMASRPLNSTHGQTTLGVACHHHLWAAKTVGRRRAWHSIVALGRQTSRTTSGVECHHLLWACHGIISFRQHRRSDDVGRGMPSPPLDSTHRRTTSGMA